MNKENNTTLKLEVKFPLKILETKSVNSVSVTPFKKKKSDIWMLWFINSSQIQVSDIVLQLKMHRTISKSANFIEQIHCNIVGAQDRKEEGEEEENS